MKEQMLMQIEKEVLPKISLWVDTNREVKKLTFTNYRKFFNNGVKVRSDLILPTTDEEFEAVGNILLFITQNPESKAVDSIISASGFDKMIENILTVY